MIGLLALVMAALFTGAAVYITWAEQPARLALDDRALLAQWKPSYARGFTMQASLAVVGFVLGLAAWWMTGNTAWLAGAIVLIANWPFTLLVIMPINHRLNDIAPDQASQRSRDLIKQWGWLHAVRSGLGGTATLMFLWAAA